MPGPGGHFVADVLPEGLGGCDMRPPARDRPVGHSLLKIPEAQQQSQSQSLGEGGDEMQTESSSVVVGPGV